MTEELRLIRLGWPLEGALTLCYSLRKEGKLTGFVEAEEAKARNETGYILTCRNAAREVLD